MTTSTGAHSINQNRPVPGRGAVLAQFEAVRAMTERLTAPLGPEDQMLQSMADASPTRWHRAHTSWFFETFILKAAAGKGAPDYRPYHPAYEMLFNSYYETVGPQFPRPQRGLLSRPTVAEVGDYRAHVDEAVRRFVADAEDAVWADAAPMMALGCHHEQQHQELVVTDIKHALAANPLDPAAYTLTPSEGAAPPLRWHGWEGGIRRTGHDRGDPAFAFDNEGPEHETLIRPFKLASRPATNGEFLRFIDDGGYTTARYWLADGWAMVNEQGWTAPGYWRREADGWSCYTLAGRRPVDPAAPVTHISFYEAAAFAEWSGRRLPTEVEWEVAARGAPVAGHFLDPDRLHPAATPASADDHLHQIYGSVWEWTASPYVAYPGFRPPPGAVGEYNGKFMSGQMVLRGGSCATPADHVRATYRNFFPPHARWQFSGVRLADDA